jgi:hypothetical protein
MLISLLQEIPTQKQVDLRLNLDKHGKHALAIRKEVERQYLPKDASRPHMSTPCKEDVETQVWEQFEVAVTEKEFRCQGEAESTNRSLWTKRGYRDQCVESSGGGGEVDIPRHTPRS